MTSGKKQDSKECPLCMEILEIDDLNFFPCTCKYQVCRFCWNRIITSENGLCPACRRAYNSEEPASFQPMTTDEIKQIKRKQKYKMGSIEDGRKDFSDKRVLQENLLFIVNLPPNMPRDEDLLKSDLYFGKYGTVLKVVVNQTQGNNNPGSTPKNVSSSSVYTSAYVTYKDKWNAMIGLLDMNAQGLNGMRSLKVSFGTTKYCAQFLKGQPCTKRECMYLHHRGEDKASFTKEDMTAGKHTQYEAELIRQFRADLDPSLLPEGHFLAPKPAPKPLLECEGPVILGAGCSGSSSSSGPTPTVSDLAEIMSHLEAVGITSSSSSSWSGRSRTRCENSGDGMQQSQPLPPPPSASQHSYLYSSNRKDNKSHHHNGERRSPNSPPLNQKLSTSGLISEEGGIHGQSGIINGTPNTLSPNSVLEAPLFSSISDCPTSSNDMLSHHPTSLFSSIFVPSFPSVVDSSPLSGGSAGVEPTQTNNNNCYVICESASTLEATVSSPPVVTNDDDSWLLNIVSENLSSLKIMALEEQRNNADTTRHSLRSLSLDQSAPRNYMTCPPPPGFEDLSTGPAAAVNNCLPPFRSQMSSTYPLPQPSPFSRPPPAYNNGALYETNAFMANLSNGTSAHVNRALNSPPFNRHSSTLGHQQYSIPGHSSEYGIAPPSLETGSNNPSLELAHQLRSILPMESTIRIGNSPVDFASQSYQNFNLSPSVPQTTIAFNNNSHSSDSPYSHVNSSLALEDPAIVMSSQMLNNSWNGYSTTSQSIYPSQVRPQTAFWNRGDAVNQNYHSPFYYSAAASVKPIWGQRPPTLDVGHNGTADAYCNGIMGEDSRNHALMRQYAQRQFLSQGLSNNGYCHNSSGDVINRTDY